MKTNTELKAGLFLGTALVLFTVGIWILGSERQVFSSKSEFSTSFKNVQGLSRGAPVRLSGISIGRVESIGFGEKNEDNEVHIIMSINEDYLSRIKTDSVATIQTQGLLGDKFLSIHPGAATKTLTPGNRIESRELKDIADTLQRAGQIINKTAKISEDLSDVIEDFKGSTLTNITKTSQNLAEITEQIKSGKGLIGELIYSKEEAIKVKSTFDELKKIAKNLEEVTKSLSQGTGTIGALLLDASLYDNLVEVTDEAKRSFLLKQAIRSSIKKEKKSAD